MKKICYALYALWMVSAIVLKIFGLVSWWVATSWLWIPLAMILVFIVGINFAVILGKRMQEKEESKIPDSCATCLYGQAAKYADGGKCLGEALDEKCKQGTLCSNYKRHILR